MVDKFNRVIGANFSRARRSSTLTQKQVGDAVGLSSVTIGHIENGRTGATLTTFVQLCALYGLDPTRVLAGTVGLETATGKKPNSN